MAERAQLAGLQRPGHRAGIGDGHQHLSGRDGLHGIAAAAIGDVLELRAGALVEQLARRAGTAWRSRRSWRAWDWRLPYSTSSLHRLHRLLGADRQQQRELGEQRDRREVLQRVE